MTFSFGPESKRHLIGVHPDLVRVATTAIEYTTQDFGVYEGLRSLATQGEYIRRGVSWRLDSKHLVQPDGMGHAVDLVPYILGKLRWEWEPIYDIAAAVLRAAHEHDVRLRWGGVWDRTSDRLPTDRNGLKTAVRDYCVRHPGPDRIDGPHWELA